MKKSLKPTIVAGIISGILLLVFFHFGAEIQISGKVTLTDYAFVLVGLLAAINALIFFITYNKKPKKSLKKEMAFCSSLTGTYAIGVFITIPPF